MAQPAPFIRELYGDASLRANCSGFFKAVADELDLDLPDLQADPLIDYISRGAGGWVKIGEGPTAGPLAANLAGQGYFVVALLKAADHLPFKLNRATGKYDIPHAYSHGHLAIVVPGGTIDGYPYVVSGSLIADGQSDGTKAVRGVWRGVDAPKVKYYRSATTYPLLMPGRATR